MTNGLYRAATSDVSTWEQIRRILSVVAAIIAAITGTTAVSMHASDRHARSMSSSSPATSPASAK